MTNATDLAAEALRKKLPELKSRVRQFEMMELPGQPLGMHMGTAYLVGDLSRALDEALAALTAEQSRVPEDRERLAKEIEDIIEKWATDRSINKPRDFGWHDRQELIQSLSATFLRQPVAEEVEAMAKQLETCANAGFNYAQEVARDAAAFLRRLSLPIAGGWRSIESAPKWEGECSPEVIIWDGYVCIARQFAEWSYDRYHRDEKNAWVVGGGYVKHPTHWQPLPSPPSPEETGR